MHSALSDAGGNGVAVSGTGAAGGTLLKDILDSSAVGICVLEAIRDAAGRVTDFRWVLRNAAAERITGWPIAQWVGRPFAGLIHLDDLPRVSDRYLTVMSGHGPLPAPFEARVLRANGTFCLVEISVAPQREQGRVIGALGVA